jgi:hypothetical protein
MEAPVLIDGLDLAANGSHQRKMMRRREGHIEPPARGAWKLGVPEFLGNRRDGRRGPGRACKHHTLEEGRHGTERLGETEGEGAAGKNVPCGVESARGIAAGGEAQGDFMEAAIVAPEPGGGAFGHDVKAIVPGAFTEGAEAFESFMEKIGRSIGRGSESGKMHRA